MSNIEGFCRYDEDTTGHLIEVDVIIPVHNASKTIVETVASAMNQQVPERFLQQQQQQQDERWTAARTTTTTTEELLRNISVHVCCYDDGSTDNSWELLKDLKKQYDPSTTTTIATTTTSTTNQQNSRQLTTKLWIAKGEIGRGAGYARNRAVAMRDLSSTNVNNDNNDKNNNSKSTLVQRFLCLLDSDDTMHPHRVAEQVAYFLQLSPTERPRTLLGCTFDRDPPDSTWHYAQWANNNLTDERLYLERFREVTLLQPTWMMCRSRFEELGGYMEAPPPEETSSLKEYLQQQNEQSYSDCKQSNKKRILRLIHPTFETSRTLRVAEDLRFFHAHLYDDGKLKLLRHDNNNNNDSVSSQQQQEKILPQEPLVTYRHHHSSQSSQTPRKLLLQLRALAFEQCILRLAPLWQHRFCIWGAGRDGKDFFKALSSAIQQRVYCFVDVDEKKIGYYVNREMKVKIPVVHFSLLAADPAVRKKLTNAWEQEGEMASDLWFGHIDKSRSDGENSTKKEPSAASDPVAKKPRRLHALSKADELDLDLLPKLPVVVCVAMYRTNGALEANVASIGRTEGKDLWHFS